MSRNKITQEAKERAEADAEPSSDTDTESESGREQLTQRMPHDLVDDVDGFADEMGLSRNAAINFIVRSWINENR